MVDPKRKSLLKNATIGFVLAADLAFLALAGGISIVCWCVATVMVPNLAWLTSDVDHVDQPKVRRRTILRLVILQLLVFLIGMLIRIFRAM